MSDSSSSAISKLHAFLTSDFCNTCRDLLYDRLKQLELSETLDGIQIRLPNIQEGNDFPVSNHADKGLDNDHSNGNVGRNWHKKQPTRWSEPSSQTPSYGLVAMKRLSSNSASSIKNTKSEKPKGNPLHVGKSGQETDFDKLDDEWTRLSLAKRKKDFRLMENIRGRPVNVLQGLELHTGIFNHAEQERIVNLVYSFQKLGREGKLRERTYSEPKKWLRGKGRVTIQFGCCYNYATIRYMDDDPLWDVLPGAEENLRTMKMSSLVGLDSFQREFHNRRPHSTVEYYKLGLFQMKSKNKLDVWSRETSRMMKLLGLNGMMTISR